LADWPGGKWYRRKKRKFTRGEPSRQKRYGNALQNLMQGAQEPGPKALWEALSRAGEEEPTKGRQIWQPLRSLAE